MPTWIDMNADFGMPWKLLSVGMGGREGSNMRAEIHRLQKLGNDPERLAAALLNMVVAVRPELADGRLVILGIECQLWSDRFVIRVLHPSFPRIIPGKAFPALERLSPCPVCRGAISADPETEVYQRPNPDNLYGPQQMVGVCSEACVSRKA